VDPKSALRRVAYLLERDGAETYKVRAFRNAAAAIEAIPLADLEKLSTRQLVEIPHVGSTSAKIIASALSGETPEYLAQLEQLESSQSPSISEAAAGLRSFLQGDCHSHSDWSDGGSPILEMAETARDLGHRYCALTDHSPRLTVARGLSAERLREQLALVSRLNSELSPFRILTGIEVDIMDDGSLDQDAGLLAELDVVVASVHSKLRMERAEMTRRMLLAVANPHADVLGHCTGRLLGGRGRPPSSFDAEAVFTMCADSGTAVEINSRPERLDPPQELLELAFSLGCDFVIDTDAHAPGQLEWQWRGCEKAVEAGVPPERIMNTRRLDEFLSWTASHAT
jgi:putative hydrolase